MLGYQLPDPPRPAFSAAPADIDVMLDSVNCRSFDAGSVTDYKTAMTDRDHAAAEKLLHHVNRVTHRRTGSEPTPVQFVLLVLACFVFVGGLVGTIIGSARQPTPENLEWLERNPMLETRRVAILWMTTIPLFVLAVRANRYQGMTQSQYAKYLEDLREQARQTPFTEWHRDEISDYRSTLPIPQPVLELALELKAAFPQMRFEIDYLRPYRHVSVEHAQTRAESRARDPFLVAQFNGESRYIAVWDEDAYRVAWSGGYRRLDALALPPEAQ